MNYLFELIFFFLIVVENAGECGSGKDECNGHGFFGSENANGICECICDVGYRGQFCTDREDVPNIDCNAGQFPLLGGFIVYQTMHNSEIRSVDCPGGFAGSARLQCKAGTVNLLGGSCWIVYHVDTHAPTQAPTNPVIYLTPGPITPTVVHIPSISPSSTISSSQKSFTTAPISTTSSSIITQEEEEEEEEEEEVFDETVRNEEEESDFLPIITSVLILVVILMIVCYAFYRFQKKRKKKIQFKRMEENDDEVPSKASPHVILFNENEIKTPRKEKPDSLFHLKEGFKYTDYITKSANTMTGRSRAPTFTIQFDTNPSNIPEVDLYGVGSISPIYSEGEQNESDSELGESELEDLYQNNTCPRYGEETRFTSSGSISQYHPQFHLQQQHLQQNQHNQNFYRGSIGQYSAIDSSQSEQNLEKNRRLFNDMQSNSQNPCRYSYSSDGHNVYRYYRHFNPMDKQTNGQIIGTSTKPTRKFVTKKNYSKVTGKQCYSDDHQPTTTSSMSTASSFVSNLVKKFSPRRAKRFNHAFESSTCPQQLPPKRTDSSYKHKNYNNRGDFYDQKKTMPNDGDGIQDQQQQKYDFSQIRSRGSHKNPLPTSSSVSYNIHTPQFKNPPVPPPPSANFTSNAEKQQSHHHSHPHFSCGRKRDPSITSQYMQHDYTE